MMQCNECLNYKVKAASLLYPSHEVDYNSFFKGDPTYKNLPLQDATKDFLNTYISSGVAQYGTTEMETLSKKLGVSRTGLYKYMEKSDVNLEQITNSIESPAANVSDPIHSYFVQQATGGYDLKKHISDFKKTYANNRAKALGFYNAAMELGYDSAKELLENDTREIIRYGMEEAAQSLQISQRRLHDIVKDYYNDVMPEHNRIQNTKDELSEMTPEWERIKKEQEKGMEKNNREENFNSDSDTVWGNTG